MNGLFITFEGDDGTGKTTQAKRLSEYLTQEGYEVCVTREIGGTPISEQIRDVFLNPNNNEITPTTELLLITAARAQHVSEVILPALQDGKIVISDRFADSTVVYQCYQGESDLVLTRRLNRIATGGLSPNLTFVLDLPVEIGLQRVQQRQDEMNRLDLEDFQSHKRVRYGYLAIARQEPDRIKVIDAMSDADSIHELIKLDVDGLLHKQ